MWALNFPGSENKHFGLNTDDIMWFCKCALCRSNLAHNDIIDELPTDINLVVDDLIPLLTSPLNLLRWAETTGNLRAHHHFYSYSFIFIIFPPDWVTFHHSSLSTYKHFSHTFVQSFLAPFVQITQHNAST